MGKASSPAQDHIKVMIVGTGNVGASIGFSLVTQGAPINELVLTDINADDAEGEAMDLRDALAVSPRFMNIHSGTYASDAKDSDIIIITAGVPQKPGESRMDLLQKNAKIFKDMIKEIMDAGFDGLFLVVSNPMDVMTQLVQEYSGLDPSRVIGSGTVLDSARLRFQIAQELKISPKSVHAYQVGEHGDTEFALWSSSTVAGQPLAQMLPDSTKNELEDYTRHEAYDIIAKKGATYYGIGACVTDIVNCIIHDEHRVLPISTYDDFSKVYYGFPAVLGKNGVERRLDLNLSEEEGIKLQKSINTLKEAFNETRSVHLRRPLRPAPSERQRLHQRFLLFLRRLRLYPHRRLRLRRQNEGQRNPHRRLPRN